ncbi:phage tail protein [Duganella sp. Root1480D1]|uniref:phage tail protein n=1 Tax=Duganella sp. Root1480D1 TaxID=1736471 RepID=UPI000710A02F|nr:tail fiber protein [Duganella sp. Root1480D1]KQZ26973.1 phage tail protein [Duganella sp. Root1480D1]
MAERYIGEIRMFSGNFAPVGWAMCNGQLLPIAQNTALFSILGTTYGGDGKTTFALPNLRQRIPMHAGAGPGLTLRDLGEQGGAATSTLTALQMPSHSHGMSASNATASVQSPANALLAKPVTVSAPYHDAAAMAPSPTGPLGAAGGNSPHNNLQPYLVLNFIIALSGIFPPRS